LNALHTITDNIHDITNEELIEGIKNLRNQYIMQDISHLRDAALVLEREGKSYQQDLYERISQSIDELVIKDAESTPPIPPKKSIKEAAAIYEQTRKSCYAAIEKIRDRLTDDKTKRELYVLTWEIPDNKLEDLLTLFREAIIRYNQMHKNIFTRPRGVEEILYKLSLIGVTEVEPTEGDEFDPAWHLHLDSQKTGFDFVICSTVHSGYKRNGRRILKAVVNVK